MFFEAISKPSNSLFWKCLLNQKEFMRTSIYFQIKNGVNTNVWDDPWIPSIPSVKPLPNPLYSGYEQNTKVAKLTLENPKRWNTLLIDILFMEHISKEIQKILLTAYSFHYSPNKIRWLHNLF